LHPSTPSLPIPVKITLSISKFCVKGITELKRRLISGLKLFSRRSSLEKKNPELLTMREVLASQI
jgi:hypothetical protein